MVKKLRCSYIARGCIILISEDHGQKGADKHVGFLRNPTCLSALSMKVISNTLLEQV
jgi:hypothetical protein